MKFTPVEVSAPDLQVRAAGRLLWQFQRSPVLLQVLWALVSEMQALCDAAAQTMQARTPYAAVGENLNAIGRIVGQDRVLLDYSRLIWFQPDTPNMSVDQAPVWCRGGPIFASSVADDMLYRILIQSKVYRNFVRFCSIPECQEAALEAFGVNISFAFTGPMRVNLLVPFYIPLYVLGFLTSKTTDARVDDTYIMPYPATVKVDKTMFLFPVTFRPDVAGCGPDTDAGVSVGFYF